ncbi:carboxylesterase family protein [Streptomyces sp. NPDC092903]|uniref:carboxylesterase family protein n=1 Tax=Streptomyces sp. NPDC092903 TaxID=3366017 RepID=UPI0037F1C8A6
MRHEAVRAARRRRGTAHAVRRGLLREPSGGGCGGGADARTGAGGGRTAGGESTAAVRHFLGVPYAKPPAGGLRWAPPHPAAPWPGVRPPHDLRGRLPAGWQPGVRCPGTRRRRRPGPRSSPTRRGPAGRRPPSTSARSGQPSGRPPRRAHGRPVSPHETPAARVLTPPCRRAR